MRNSETLHLIKLDLFRFSGSKSFKSFCRSYKLSQGFRYMFFFRIVTTTTKWSPIGIIARLFYRRLTNKFSFQIPKTVKIGGGFKITHFGTLIINSKVVIGDNCNIYPGVTIGASFRGKKKGVPQIGNRVWIGSNAIIVGKVEIGDNVLIAPGAFVNIDVPSNSVVIGNPCVIKCNSKATDAYLWNLV